MAIGPEHRQPEHISRGALFPLPYEVSRQAVADFIPDKLHTLDDLNRYIFFEISPELPDVVALLAADYAKPLHLPGGGIQNQSTLEYTRGFLSFYKAAESNAERQGLPLQSVQLRDVDKLADSDITHGSGHSDLLYRYKNILAQSSTEGLPDMSDPDIPLQEKFKKAVEITSSIDSRAQIFVFHPDAQNNIEVVKRVEESFRKGVRERNDFFLFNERYYLSALTESLRARYSNIALQSSFLSDGLSQISGSRDAKGVLEIAQKRRLK